MATAATDGAVTTGLMATMATVGGKSQSEDESTSLFACLAPVAIVAIRPVVTAPSVAAVAVVAVPGISISLGLSSSSRLWLGICGPLSVVAIVAIRPVVAAPSVSA